MRLYIFGRNTINFNFKTMFRTIKNWFLNKISSTYEDDDDDYDLSNYWGDSKIKTYNSYQNLFDWKKTKVGSNEQCNINIVENEGLTFILPECQRDLDEVNFFIEEAQKTDLLRELDTVESNLRQRFLDRKHLKKILKLNYATQ